MASSTSHWGAYRIDADGDRVEVRPHPDDPAPSPLLGNIASSLRHPTRVRAPAVRRGWWEDGPGPTTRRGADDFVEPGWDAVLDRLAGELGRVRDLHGNSAIFGGSYGWASAGRFHHAQSQLHRFLNSFGGYTGSRNTYSNGTSQVVLPHIVGDNAALHAASSWSTITGHVELIVAFGGIPEKNVFVTPGGVTRHSTPGHLAALGRRGVRVALVSPLRADLPAGLDASWYPLVPGTDVALMLGLAHTLASEGLHDTGFLARYCVGYETFERYLFGELDGVVKDASWAGSICELDPVGIQRLAREMAASRTLVTVTWSLQRIQHGEQPVWAGIALAAMLGQIGLPGGGFGHGYGSMGDVGETGSTVRLPHLPQGVNPVRTFIPVARIADLLLNPGVEYDYDGQRLTYPDIRLVYWAGGNPFHHHQDLNRLRVAFGRPDTVVVHEPYWTSTARHADVVLPSTVSLEREDFGAGRRDTHLIAMHKAVEPFGDSWDDYSIFAGLAERLGIEFTEGRTAGEWLRFLYGGWRDSLGAEVIPDFDTFWADGGVALPVSGRDIILFERFRADPVASPLRTPSGRIEITSEVVQGFAYSDCPGYPAWLPGEEWLGGARALDFPLHLVANQPRSRLHSQLDVGEVSMASKRAGREPLVINPVDAAARGVADGDVVRVHNDRGACLAGAVVTSDIRPGVVQLATGAWFDPTGSMCVHGNPNVLTADVPSSRLSQGCAGQHVLVEVSRFEGALPPVTVRRPPRSVDD